VVGSGHKIRVEIDASDASDVVVVVGEVEARRPTRSASSAALAQVEELVNDVPDELEDLGSGDERSSDPQTQLTADVTDQRSNVVLRTLFGHKHLSTVAPPSE